MHIHLTKATASRTLIALSLAAASAFTTGCHKKTPAPPPSSMGPTTPTAEAPTATLTADPVAVDLGQTVVLNWRTTHATSVMIDGIGKVNTSGTQTASPSSSTNFHLTATGDGGTTEANVRVTVRAATAPTASTGDTGNVSDDAFHAAVQDLFFDYDAIDLRPDAQTSATAAAAFLAAHPNLKVLIGGYCDERGSAEYNLALGENRANSAKTALVNAGVAATRLRVISYGKEKQFCTESNETCWQENRRAQFTIDR